MKACSQLVSGFNLLACMVSIRNRFNKLLFFPYRRNEDISGIGVPAGGHDFPGSNLC